MLSRRPGRPEPNPHAANSALAAALDEVARAEKRAEAARVRATQLTQGLTERSSSAPGAGETKATEHSDISVTDTTSSAMQQISAGLLLRRLLRRPKRATLAAVAAIMLICALLGLSGYVLRYHHRNGEDRERAAQFAAAARQNAVTLMSIDVTKARGDVQRIIDDSTGAFKTGMMLNANDLVQAVEQSKVSTKVTVRAAAVASMTTDSAVVLLATKAEVANPAKDQPPPRSWRIVMTLQRDGGQLKMSKVEFLP